MKILFLVISAGHGDGSMRVCSLEGFAAEKVIFVGVNHIGDYTLRNTPTKMVVGCIDYTLIPSQSTIFIKNGFYRLKFKVEHPVDVGDNEDDAPRSPPPGDEGDDSDSSSDRGEDKREQDNTKTDAMVTDEVSNNSGVKGTEGAAASEPMQENVMGVAISSTVQKNVTGVAFSPMVKKQFHLAKQQLLALAANDGANDLGLQAARESRGVGACYDTEVGGSGARGPQSRKLR